MPDQPASAGRALPPLPHWDQTPADVPEAVREIKAALRARIAASGRTVEEVFAAVGARIEAEVAEITAARERGEPVWPVLDYADIEAVPASARALLRRRGCLVVRGHFAREQALAWDRGLVDYVKSNRFFENYRVPAQRAVRAERPGGLPDRVQPGRFSRRALRARVAEPVPAGRPQYHRAARPWQGFAPKWAVMIAEFCGRPASR